MHRDGFDEGRIGLDDRERMIVCADLKLGERPRVDEPQPGPGVLRSGC